MSARAHSPTCSTPRSEEELRAAVRDLLADRCDAGRGVIARTDGGHAARPRLWKALAADIGLAGLLVPEERGGQGASHREAAVVLEELGRAVAPVPYPDQRGRRHRGAARLRRRATPRRRCWRALASGGTTGALAVPLSTAPGERLQRPYAVEDGGGCTAESTGVADAVVADVLLVPGATTAGCTRCAADAVTVDPAVVPRPDPAARRRSPSTARAGDGCWRATPSPPYDAPCSPGPGCSPPSSSGSPSGALTETVALPQGAPPVQPARRRLPGAQAPARRSSGWRSSACAPPPATPPTPLADRRPRRRRWRSPSPRRTRPPSPCTPPRRRCSCTAASA